MRNEPSRFNFANSKPIYQLANSHQFCRGKFADVPNFYHEQLIHCIRYKRLPRHGFVWSRQITFGSNGAEEEWLSQNSTLSSWSTFTAAGTLISLETDWLLWLQQGSITLDPWPLTWNEKEGRRRKASVKLSTGHVWILEARMPGTFSQKMTENSRKWPVDHDVLWYKKIINLQEKHILWHTHYGIRVNTCFLSAEILIFSFKFDQFGTFSQIA